MCLQPVVLQVVLGIFVTTPQDTERACVTRMHDNRDEWQTLR